MPGITRPRRSRRGGRSRPGPPGLPERNGYSRTIGDHPGRDSKPEMTPTLAPFAAGPFRVAYIVSVAIRNTNLERVANGTVRDGQFQVNVVFIIQSLQGSKVGIR